MHSMSVHVQDVQCADDRIHSDPSCTVSASAVSALQGYGTVRFETAEAVQAAIQQLHGSDLEGRTLTVRLDKFA